MDLVSVIIPCYNVSSFVDNFSWIFEQTYSELEVVLVDDCSTDDTWQKLQVFKHQYVDKRIVLAQNEQNLGAGETRNQGLAVSSGKYVCFWDADDRASPLFVEKMLAKLKQEQADFVCCGLTMIDSNGRQKYLGIAEELTRTQSIDELKQLFFLIYDGPVTKLICRDYLQRYAISFPKILRGEDHCWTVQLILNAQKIAFINESYYQYIDNSLSLSHVSDVRAEQSFWRMMSFDSDYIDKIGLTILLHDASLMSFFRTLMYFYRETQVELRDRLILDVRDYCQQHQIDLTGQALPLSYRFRVYRFLPNIGFLAKKRKEMKQTYYQGHKLYEYMRETLVLVKVAETKAKDSL